MTRVQVCFRLQSPLEERQAARLAEVHGIYGMLAIRFQEAENSLTVEYDATRLTVEEVALHLRRAGIAVFRD